MKVFRYSKSFSTYTACIEILRGVASFHERNEWARSPKSFAHQHHQVRVSINHLSLAARLNKEKSFLCPWRKDPTLEPFLSLPLRALCCLVSNAPSILSPALHARVLNRVILIEDFQKYFVLCLCPLLACSKHDTLFALTCFTHWEPFLSFPSDILSVPNFCQYTHLESKNRHPNWSHQ